MADGYLDMSVVSGSTAIVIGARGGVGRAFCEALERDRNFARVVRFSRPSLDVADEASIAAAAQSVADHDIRLVINAVGLLHDTTLQPEKSLRQLDTDQLARSFAINAIGPALLMKHFLPRLARGERAVFANLSARVGSIGDNRLGGWYGYRASKAALNQFVRTASIELARTHPHAICVALHPGTVATRLSEPFRRADQTLFSPEESAAHLLGVIAKLKPSDSGQFFDWRGQPILW